MIARGAAAAGLSMLLAGGAFAADGQEGYRRLNEALIDHHILPRYERLATATAAMAEDIDASCPAEGPVDVEALRAAFHEGMDAWQEVQHVRFGSVELLMRGFRMSFWPDPRDSLGEALHVMLADADEAALSADAFIDASVTIQGFPALERLLFDEEQVGALTAGQGMPFRCDLIRTIAGNIAGMSADISREWSEGEDSYRNRMLTPGEDSLRYYDHQEASLDLLQALHGALEITADMKLGPPLGEDIDGASPHLTESWRSGRSLRNIVLNLEAARDLYAGGDGFGFDDYLRDIAGNPDLADLFDRAFVQTLATAASIDMPLAVAVADPDARPKVEKLKTEASAIAQLIEERMTVAMGLTLGFNALDGD